MITFVAFVWLFPTVYFHMHLQRTWVRTFKVTLITFFPIFLHCVLSNDSSACPGRCLVTLVVLYMEPNKWKPTYLHRWSIPCVPPSWPPCQPPCPAPSPWPPSTSWSPLWPSPSPHLPALNLHPTPWPTPWPTPCPPPLCHPHPPPCWPPCNLCLSSTFSYSLELHLRACLLWKSWFSYGEGSPHKDSNLSKHYFHFL